jgi:hypothetical protein
MSNALYCGRDLMEYKEFRIHDIAIRHPSAWRISMKNLALQQEGDVDLFGSNKNQIAVSVSWKPLSRYTQRFPTVNDYSDHVIKNFGKERRFSNFQVISQNSLQWKGHPAARLHLRFQMKVGIFSRKTQMIDRVNFFSYCLETNRAIIVYISLSADAYEEEKGLVREIMGSIQCHKDRP